MGELEDKLSSILGNPQMMQSIMNMAQQMSAQAEPQPEKQQMPPVPQSPQFGGNELEMIRKIASFSQKTGLDSHQQDLLHALHPYLGSSRLGKLENAMHAAKLAQFASVALSDGAGLFSGGR